MVAEVSASPADAPTSSSSLAATAGGGGAPNSNNNNNNEKPSVYNPRWKGYIYICFFSLVNFASLVNIPNDAHHAQPAAWAASVTFGVVTFALGGIILLTDRFQLGTEFFHFTQAASGNFEGFTLIFFTLWWIIGVAYTTRVGGLSYFSNNIYLSSWASLAACLYNLNEWSTDKDYLSFQELTSLSATLRSWYVLCLFSLIVMGTAGNLHDHVAPGSLQRETSLGVTVGLISTVVSFFFILVHSHCCGNHKKNSLFNGGWLELGLDFFLIILWIITVAILTQVGGVGSTFSGTGCLERTLPSLGLTFDAAAAAAAAGTNDCTLVLTTSSTDNNNNNSAAAPRTTVSCSTLVEREIPGSNLYLASWICLAAALNITLRWKAAQALQFAHTAQTRQQYMEDADEEDDNNNNNNNNNSNNNNNGNNNNNNATAANINNHSGRGDVRRRRDDTDDENGDDAVLYDDDDDDDEAF